MEQRGADTETFSGLWKAPLLNAKCCLKNAYCQLLNANCKMLNARFKWSTCKSVK